MTTRYKGFVVALDKDVRDDDAEPILAAIRMVKGVADVQPVEATSDDWIVRQQVAGEVANDLFALWRRLKRINT